MDPPTPLQSELERLELFRFVLKLYNERLSALTTISSLRLIYELTKLFGIPMSDFCRFVAEEVE